ncbi:MAG: hypothetical protein A2Z06_03085 [Candidatus Glassbacteria bacterium RBG_16_58_8]|uniref:Sigma-54-dependent Fis family transcriptional regulator n=1 Tax=Candidatus Glassbacteria bacterium RBG_16_58_8 TaxID=1817866 RepID=A0A1F5YCZ5_9BACT|nr:MAG: hypothetical protein A2Z06_03085 [Candidatus Glassbacteria bacterium RBG_16_58_8]
MNGRKEKSGERIRVLVIDDEPGSRETLKDILEEEGYLVSTAGEWGDALEQMSREHVHIALLDIRLPGMNGVEVLERIRRESPDTAVIMITAYATLENSIRALNLGAYSYLTKPLNIDEVKVQIRRVVENLDLAAERDRLLLETKRWASQLQVVNEMTRGIIVSHDVKELLKVMYREMGEVVRYDDIVISLLDPDKQTIEEFRVDVEGVKARYLPGGKVLRDHAVGWVIRMQEPLITPSLLGNSPFEDERDRLSAGYRSRVILPLAMKGNAMGAVAFESREEGEYREDQLGLLRLIGRQLSVALENARLYEELLESKEALEVENVDLRTKVSDRYNFGNMVVESPEMKEIMRLVARVINSCSAVFLEGESGTGKELIAHCLHFQGPRKEKPFVVVNCGAIPENLLESELFGYEKGAFTGADRVKEGLFERANGGTFFLDEVDELSKALQVKLLRVLQDGEVRRLGAVTSKVLDVRIIAATNRDLKRLVEEKKFREDIFYRLHVYPIRIPPLRERREDIIPLAEHFLEKYRRRTPNRVKDFSSAARSALLRYDWPGNVRELEHVVEKSIHLADGKWIEPEDLGLKPGPESEDGEARWTLKVEREELMRKRVEEALKSHAGNRARAARELGIHRTQLYRYMKRYDIR